MKFIIKNELKESVVSLMRKIGYRFQKEDKERRETAFIYPLARSGYPRFHIYLKINPVRDLSLNGANEQTQQIFFNLHLDQKKPVYKGTPAHSADYEGEVVENEARRIKEILQKN